MGAGGKAGGKQRVNDYHLSIHYGICHGPVIFKSIKYKQKYIWQGEISEPGFVDVHLPDLFGGPTQEGGVSGRIYFMPGNADQVAPAALAAKFGLTPATCPAFRGVATLFFTGGPTTLANVYDHLGGDIIDAIMDYYSTSTNTGFLWASNNPYLEGVEVEVECVMTHLGETNAVIGGRFHNPAHMLYAAFVDQNFGMGAPPWLLGTASFTAVAEQLYNEQFGLGIKWNKQEPIETFAAEIIDHIQATVFVNPATGLLDLKLLRADYDPDTLQELNPGNAKLINFERRLFGQTSNEIIVSWTNPDNEQSETLSGQDLANLDIQGAPVSANRDYYAIRSAELAQRVLDRDLRSSSAPLAALEIEVDRRGWALTPGAVVRANFPKRGVNNIIGRITKISYGKAKASKIRVSLLEDIFALDLPDTIEPPTTRWTNIQSEPAPIDHSEIITIPSFFTHRLIGNGIELTYPEVLAGVLAAKDGTDVVSFQMMVETAGLTGTAQWSNQGDKSILGRAQLLTPLYQEAQSLIAGLPLTQTLRNPRLGSFVLIGTGGDMGMEIGVISSFDADNNAWVVDRGVLDTVPRSWPVDTPVWFLPIDANIADTKELKAVNEDVDFKLLTRTSLGVLPFEDAATISGTMTGRPYCPLRPANVKINGVGFGKVNAAGATELVVTWSNRNRKLEDGQVIRWSDSNVAPEYLQETIITIFRENGTLMYYRKGLWTETSFTIPIAWVQQESKVFIRVSSQRSGFASIQSYGLWVENIPHVSSPSPPPASDDGPPAPPPPDDPDDPTPEPLPGIEDPPLPDLGGGPGQWN